MLTINRERFLRDLDDMAQIGATGDGGVSRPALSPEDVAARHWYQAQVEAAGLEFRSDGAGNLSAVLRSDQPNARTLIVGSHLDSVVNGGRFDGALGVLCALEAVRILRESGERLPFHVEAISFTDEEGSILGLVGSMALAGQLRAEEFETPRGGRDQLLAGMERIGISQESVLNARRDPASLQGYIEVHIEQGTRLEEARTNIGVVTAMVGIRSFSVRFFGAAAHAGAMPMARQLVMEQYTPGVVNFGQINARPGGFNIVPAEVELALEFRHSTNQQIDAMQGDLLALAQSVAVQYNLTVETRLLDTVDPAPMDEAMMAAIEQASDTLGLSHKRLLSFAGHDAQIMSQITPSVLYFVPSVDGISHNPQEYTSPDDCVNGANVMLQAILALR
jgi:hydantoinase/carbamoylase family amidase